MSENDFKELKKLIVAVAEYYERVLSARAVIMMAEDLKNYPLELVSKGYEQYRKHDKLFKFPMPAQIISIIDPQPTDDSLSREIAAKISSAVTKFGWCNSEEAKNYIGEIGWRVVEKRGGWAHICQNLRTNDTASFDAQNRELAKSAILAHNNPKFAELLDAAAKGMSLPESKQNLEERREMLLDQAKDKYE